MLAAGIVELFLGVDAEQRSLEQIATPLSATTSEGDFEPAAAPAESLRRQIGPYPVPRRRLGSTSWAPRPQLSNYPRSNPYLAREVDAVVSVLAERGPQTAVSLSRLASARTWGPGRFRAAMRSGLASGRIRRMRGRYAATTSGTWSAEGRGRG